MGDAAGGCGDDVDGTHHAGRKLGQDRRFEARDGVEARMLGRARRRSMPARQALCSVSAAASIMPGSRLDALQLAHRRRRQDRLDRGAQAFVVDRPGKAAGEPRPPPARRT